jgi:hypothetical protein
MNDHGYTVVFDVLTNGARAFWFPVPGLFFIVIGLLLPRFIKSGIFRSPPWMRSWFPTVFLVFAILWTLIGFTSIGVRYLNDLNAMKSGKVGYVEGQVESFVPMPYTGHAMESFTVKGIPFSYSDYVVTPGFNNTTSHGGPIRNGLYVRIWYLQNEILKLEIKNP